MKYLLLITLFLPLFGWQLSWAASNDDLAFESFALIETLLAESSSSQNHDNEESIADIFCSREGASLTGLKELIDSQSTACSGLYDLIFHKITSESLRIKILRHFKHEAKKIKREGFKLISDIDDTLFSSVDDLRYSGSNLYPGVFAFHHEVAQNSVFVTARPYFWYHKTKKTLDHRSFKQRVVITGRLSSSIMGNRTMAMQKCRQIVNYAKIYPEFNLIWVGDNGRGDQITGKKLLKDYPENVVVVLIHDLHFSKQEVKTQIRDESGIILFDTYLGAACDLYKKKILTKEKLCFIYEQFMRDLQTIHLKSQYQQKMESIILRDVRLAEYLLNYTVEMQ